MRKRLRLPLYDYSTNGMYFITVFTRERRPLLPGWGETIVRDELAAISDRFRGMNVDIAIVMADHVHAISQLIDCDVTVSRIVQAFKSLTARKFREQQSIHAVWQRGFYDRVVRNEDELNAIREYIQLNPLVHEVRIKGIW
jgi:REP-associated tyrosine transposase